MSDLDYALALSLQDGNKPITYNQHADYKLALEISKSWNSPSPPSSYKDDPENLSLSIVDPCLETLDPNPDIWSLFTEFDERFFENKLTTNCVELSWSTSRMTSTAGLCSWNPKTNFASIKLSKPLLSLRPRSDLVETLLHEMIHAFLFVTHEDDNHESHGIMFHLHMFRINREAGTKITVFHSFHDEVRYFQKHIWRCNGPCRDKKPYYGYVRRASNRAPGPTDPWYTKHQQNCGGIFIKESEPEKRITPNTNKNVNIRDIRNWITPIKKDNNSTKSNISQSNQKINEIVPFSGKGFRLGSKNDQGSDNENREKKLINNKNGNHSKKRTKNDPLHFSKNSTENKKMKLFSASFVKSTPKIIDISKSCDQIIELD